MKLSKVQIFKLNNKLVARECRHGEWSDLFHIDYEDLKSYVNSSAWEVELL